MATALAYNNSLLRFNNYVIDPGSTPVPPTGFVMNASNAEYYKYNGLYCVAWRSPSYPNIYNGNGKQYILVNNNTNIGYPDALKYLSESKNAGSDAIESANMRVQGTSTGTLLDNIYYGPFDNPNGVYLGFSGGFQTLEEAQAYIANFSITIPDP